jgi:hypothetical protein
MAASRKLYRHGDIILEPVELVAWQRNRMHTIKGKKLVVARGEATGHAHVLEASQIVAPEHAQDLLLSPRTAESEVVLPKGGTITHEEHGTIALPPGEYAVRRQREHWGVERRVSD